jgi:hypothetical protein
MKKTRKFFLFYTVFCSLLFSFLLSFSLNGQMQQSTLIISEVFVSTEQGKVNYGLNHPNCTGKSYFTSNQYIEIFNPSETSSVNLQGFTISDGTGQDEIVAWNSNFNGTIGNQIKLQNENSLLLPPKTFGLILDPDYGHCDQNLNPHFPNSLYLFTLKTDTVPGSQGFGSNGFQSSESVVIKNSQGNVVSEYGVNFSPTSAGENNSWERRDLFSPDSAGNWQMSQTFGSISPGYQNSVQFQQLQISEILVSIPKDNNLGSFDSRCNSLPKWQSDKYIEIYNVSDKSIDLSAFFLQIGTSVDSISPWRKSVLGTPKTLPMSKSSQIITDSIVLPPKEYALVLDPDFGICDEALKIESSKKIYVYTIGYQKAFGQQLPTTINFGDLNSTSTSNILLKNKFGQVLDSFIPNGTYQGKNVIWNSLPEKPSSLNYSLSAKPGISIERRRFNQCADVAECLLAQFLPEDWQLSSEILSHTPGFENTIDETKIFFSEVMSYLPNEFNLKQIENFTALKRSQTHEYIELWNGGQKSIDLTNFSLSNGFDEEQIVPWSFGKISGLPVTSGSLILPPGKHLLILDADYALRGDQTYDLPQGTIVAAIPSGLGVTGLNPTDALTLYDGLGLPIDTFGTPYLSTRLEYQKALNNPIDNFPAVIGTNRSWEKINLQATDSPLNWQSSTDVKQNSPGYFNSVEFQKDFELSLTGTFYFPTVTSKIKIQNPAMFLIVHNLSEGVFGDIFLDMYSESSLQNFQTEGLSAQASLVQRAVQCPLVEGVWNKNNIILNSARDFVFLPNQKLKLIFQNQSEEIISNPLIRLNRKDASVIFPSGTQIPSGTTNVSMKCLQGSWIFKNLPQGYLKLRVSRNTANTNPKPESNKIPSLVSFPGGMKLNSGVENNVPMYFSEF